MTLRRSLSRLCTVAMCCSILLPLFAHAFVPDDTKYSRQWYLGQVSAPTAWDTTRGSADVVIAVLDTGVDTDHPDLRNNIWRNEDEIGANGLDDDGNGYVDDVYGWDFVDDDNNPMPDVRGSNIAVTHGTLIAGLIAAEGNNAKGVAGVAWHSRIMALRMLNADGSGDSASAAAAVDYAVANGADVINLSFAGATSESAFTQAIARAYAAGVVVIAAMGNDGQDTDADAVYPACLQEGENDWVIGVTASTEDDGASPFSNFGETCADISAPGENIYGLLYYDGSTFDDQYGGSWSGTSMSAPIVSGAAALLLSAFPALNVAEVRNALLLSVDPLELTRAQRGKYGSGRLNIAQALAVAAQYAALHEGGEAPAEEPADVGSVLAQIVLGSTSGHAPTVSMHAPDGALSGQFAAYGSNFYGGVRVALGDVNGDGVVDVVTGAGEGGGPHVRIFTTEGTLLGEFFPYATTSNRGVEVATGDVDGDGIDEILTAVGQGVSQEVIAWTMDGQAVLRISTTVFAQGALRVAAGDVDGDGKDEVLVASGRGNTPKVAVYDDSGAYLLEFAPYAENFTGGVFIAAGDVNGDGIAEIVTGTGDGGGPQVRVFSRIGAVISSFFAFDASTRHGVRVAVADIDNDGTEDIVAAPGPGMNELRVLSLNGNVKRSWGVSVDGGEGTAVAAW